MLGEEGREDSLISVMQALDEAGVPVDAVGGTSIGGERRLSGPSTSMPTRQEWALAGFVEKGNLFPPTLPALSFQLGPEGPATYSNPPEYLGDRMVEETWIPYFCVSANLTRAEIVVHDRGLLATAVRASLLLPGIFPPVRQGSDFLVDGGVLSNLQWTSWKTDLRRDR